MSASSSPSPPINIFEARKQLREAMEIFPPDKKAAYAEALRRCPRVVDEESPADRFMRFDQYNPWNAAVRKARYWQTRVEVFGERAFLPLTMDGQGALNADDVALLQTGFRMLLPKMKTGEVVLFHDRARLTLPAMLDRRKRLRCLFYFLNVAAELDTDMQGLVVISAYGEKTRANCFDRETVMDAIRLMQDECIPIHAVGLHLIMLSKRPILEVVVPRTLQLLERWNSMRQHTKVHRASDHLLDDLEREGFDAEGVPKVPLGGRWTFGCFRRWLEDRAREEERRYLPPAKQEEDSETERRRKREMDAAYARRKRARKKIEVEVMQEEVDRLYRQQQRLRSEGEDLETRLAQATRLVEQLRQPPSAAMFPPVVPGSLYEPHQRMMPLQQPVAAWPVPVESLPYGAANDQPRLDQQALMDRILGLFQGNR